jgi:hypothetical protein
LVQANGSHRSFQPSMKVSIARMRSSTDVKVPRRMAWRAIIQKKISTRFSQEPEVGVKCSVIRLFLPSHAVTAGSRRRSLSRRAYPMTQ